MFKKMKLFAYSHAATWFGGWGQRRIRINDVGPDKTLTPREHKPTPPWTLNVGY